MDAEQRSRLVRVACDVPELGAHPMGTLKQERKRYALTRELREPSQRGGRVL